MMATSTNVAASQDQLIVLHGVSWQTYQELLRSDESRRGSDDVRSWEARPHVTVEGARARLGTPGPDRPPDGRRDGHELHGRKPNDPGPRGGRARQGTGL